MVFILFLGEQKVRVSASLARFDLARVATTPSTRSLTESSAWCRARTNASDRVGCSVVIGRWDRTSQCWLRALVLLASVSSSGSAARWSRRQHRRRRTHVTCSPCDPPSFFVFQPFRTLIGALGFAAAPEYRLQEGITFTARALRRRSSSTRPRRMPFPQLPFGTSNSTDGPHSAPAPPVEANHLYTVNTRGDCTSTGTG